MLPLSRRTATSSPIISAKRSICSTLGRRLLLVCCWALPATLIVVLPSHPKRQSFQGDFVRDGIGGGSQGVPPVAPLHQVFAAPLLRGSRRLGVVEGGRGGGAGGLLTVHDAAVASAWSLIAGCFCLRRRASGCVNPHVRRRNHDD